MVTVRIQLPLVVVVAVPQPDAIEPGFPLTVAVTLKEAYATPTFSTKIAARIKRELMSTDGFIQERTT